MLNGLPLTRVGLLSPERARDVVYSASCFATAFWNQILIIVSRQGLAIATLARLFQASTINVMNTAAVHYLTWAVAAVVSPRTLRIERDCEVDAEPEVRQRAAFRGPAGQSSHARAPPRDPRQAHTQIVTLGRLTDCQNPQMKITERHHSKVQPVDTAVLPASALTTGTKL